MREALEGEDSTGPGQEPVSQATGREGGGAGGGARGGAGAGTGHFGGGSAGCWDLQALRPGCSVHGCSVHGA